MLKAFNRLIIIVGLAATLVGCATKHWVKIQPSTCSQNVDDEQVCLEK